MLQRNYAVLITVRNNNNNYDNNDDGDGNGDGDADVQAAAPAKPPPWEEKSVSFFWGREVCGHRGGTGPRGSLGQRGHEGLVGEAGHQASGWQRGGKAFPVPLVLTENKVRVPEFSYKR